MSRIYSFLLIVTSTSEQSPLQGYRLL